MLVFLQAPQKAITAAIKTPSSASTFTVGTADGRVLAFSDAYEYVGGDAHAIRYVSRCSLVLVLSDVLYSSALDTLMDDGIVFTTTDDNHYDVSI